MDTRNELGKKMALFLEEKKVHTCFSLIRNQEDSSIDVMGSGRDIKDMMVKFFYG